MATISENENSSALQSHLSKVDNKQTSKDFQILLEYFPKLSVVNLYVHFENGSITSAAAALTTIDVHEDRIHIPSLNIGTALSGLVFESVVNIGPQTVRDNVIHFRLVTKPKNYLAGTGRAEVISRNFQNEAFDEGIRNLLTNSLNDVALLEHIPYSINCRVCNFILSTPSATTTDVDDGAVKFTKIRPLPGANWEEMANDLWFCHPPHPREKSPRHEHVEIKNNCPMDDEDTLTQNMSNVQITENSASSSTQTVFQAICAPDKAACYYGPCYWALNPCLVPQILFNNPSPPVNRQNNAILNIRATCPSCCNEIGIFRTKNCILLWDFGVKWVQLSSKKMTIVVEKQESQEGNQKFSSKLQSVEVEAVENFKKVIFAALYEWSFDLTCKLLVKAVDSSTSLFLWNLDKNLTIYSGELGNNSNSNVFSPQKVAKFMFCPLVNGELIVDNPCDVNVFKSGGSDHQIFVPNTVLEYGLKTLDKSSSFFLTSPGSLKCGFLTYNRI